MATPFPYRAQKTTTERLRPVKADDEGSEGKIPRWGWMSDGKLRTIERGLPLLDSLPTILDPKNDSMRPLMTFLVDKPYLKDFNRTYGALAARHPEYDLNDPDMQSHYEKQLIAQYSADPNAGKSKDLKVRMPGEKKASTKIPLDAHLHTWGGAIPYLESDIFPDDEDASESRKVVKKKPKTGIYGDQNVNAEDETSIIRTVHFKSLDDAEVKEQGQAQDNATRPLEFSTTGRRLLGPLSELAGDKIEGEFSLMRYVRSAAEAKKCYSKVRDALDCARVNGYGIVSPSAEDLSYEQPQVVRQGGSVGIKLKASAPAYHIIRVDVSGEVSPIMGEASQSENIVKNMMNQFATDAEEAWNTDVFGKSLRAMVQEGLSSKVSSLQEETRVKLRKAVTRMANEGKGGIICIIL